MTAPTANQPKNSLGDITIVTYEDTDAPKVSRKRDPGEQEDVTLSGGGFVARLFRRETSISPDTLQTKLTAFLTSMGTALAGVPDALAAYHVEEIELSLEVGAEGELSILGTGGKISGTSGITLKLKRIQDKRPDGAATDKSQ